MHKLDVSCVSWMLAVFILYVNLQCSIGLGDMD